MGLGLCKSRVRLLVLECALLAGHMCMQNVGSMNNRQKGYCFCFAASGGEKCGYIFRWLESEWWIHRRMRPAPQLSPRFEKIKRGISGCWVPTNYLFLFPRYSLTQCSPECFRVTSSGGCELEWLTEASKFRKHCIKEDEQLFLLCKFLEPWT